MLFLETGLSLELPSRNVTAAVYFRSATDAIRFPFLLTHGAASGPHVLTMSQSTTLLLADAGTGNPCAQLLGATGSVGPAALSCPLFLGYTRRQL